LQAINCHDQNEGTENKTLHQVAVNAFWLVLKIRCTSHFQAPKVSLGLNPKILEGSTSTRRRKRTEGQLSNAGKAMGNGSRGKPRETLVWFVRLD